MAEFKKYVIEFKLYDGTTRQVPIEIPLGEPGEDGGYYIPQTKNLDDGVVLSFTPTKPDMPEMEPVIIKIPESWFYTQEEKIEIAIKKASDAVDEVVAAQSDFSEIAVKALDEIREIVDDGTDAPPIVCRNSGSVISTNDSAKRMLQGLRIFGRTSQNGTPTPDAPVPLESVGDGGSVEVTVAGKNLLKKNTTGTTAQDGVTFTTAADGSITVNGTADATTYLMLTTNLRLPNGTYKLTGCPKGGAGATYRLMDGYNSGVNDTGAGIVFESTGNRRDICIRIGIGTTCNNLVFKPMISTDLDATYDDYEPYKETQTLTVQKPTDVPVFLPGIPVTSGGNYTDENGQQWICDEVDFEKGVYVQRSGEVAYTGEEYFGFDNSNDNYIRVITDDVYTDGQRSHAACTHLIARDNAPDSMAKGGIMCLTGGKGLSMSINVGQNPNGLTSAECIALIREFIKGQYANGTPVTALYVLKSPVEHDLSPDELAQYAALHTKYPNTTIFNDCGADMEVKYVADTKLYIDKKFAELSAALLNQ